MGSFPLARLLLFHKAMAAVEAAALVVSSDPDVRVGAIERLSEAGYRVAAAADAMEAVEISGRLHPAVVFYERSLAARLHGKLLMAVRGAAPSAHFICLRRRSETPIHDPRSTIHDP